MCINNNPKKAFIVLIGMLSAFYSYSQVWSDVGGGTNNSPIYFGEYNNKLIVTGGDTFGIKPIYAVASWDGIQWDSLGSANPTNGVPYCYAEFNNELYAGGGFQYMQGLVNTYHIARWDGSQWLSAGSTYNDVGWINVLAVYNNQLYAAGNITKIGGVNVNRIAKWNGSNWSSVGGGVTGGFGNISAMAVYKGQLYVGGDGKEYCSIKKSITGVYLGIDFKEAYRPAIKKLCDGIFVSKLKYDFSGRLMPASGHWGR